VLPYVSFVKVDVMGLAPARVAAIVQALRPYKVTLLAEKIDNEAQYDSCYALGFHLFQGYFFAKPVILSGRSLPPSAAVLMKLFALTAGDSEIEAIEALLKQAPDVTVRLLKLVNSAGFSPMNKISGVRNAIMVLGRVQINRLAQVMMFAQRTNANMTSDPLLQTAVIRGRVMEEIAAASGRAGLKDQAFMVGMLSLADALFGHELGTVVELLNLDDGVGAALLRREGELGVLLNLAEATERADRPAAEAAMAQLGLTDFSHLNQVQVNALSWAGTL
jgi:EAL and modified HD-GYP domain-containing signal transduction protein